LRSNKIISTPVVWWIWGSLDVICVWWFVGKDIYRGGIPYFDTANSLFKALEGNVALQLSIALSNLLLHLSIIVSCVLFLRMSKIAKWVAYAQIPFRLLFAVPSVSLSIIVIDTMPFFHDLIIPSALVFSELVKVATLWGRSFELKEDSQERNGVVASIPKDLNEPYLSEASSSMPNPKGALSFYWIAAVIVVPILLIVAGSIYKILTKPYPPYL
jgi:hypothetical protein